MTSKQRTDTKRNKVAVECVCLCLCLWERELCVTFSFPTLPTSLPISYSLGGFSHPTQLKVCFTDDHILLSESSKPILNGWRSRILSLYDKCWKLKWMSPAFQRARTHTHRVAMLLGCFGYFFFRKDWTDLLVPDNKVHSIKVSVWSVLWVLLTRAS